MTGQAEGPITFKALSLSELEAKKGMTLLSEGCTPRDVLSRFLGRYWGHDIKEGEHFEFSGEWSAHGFTAKITVWVWSDDAYWGHPCQDKKLAQDSRSFPSDPEVIEAASKLPPPTKLVRQYFRSMINSSPNVDLSPLELKEEVEKRACEYISKMMEQCWNAFTDGRA